MFTGIVHNLGKVKKREDRKTSIRFTFQPKRRETGLKTGESIAVNGVCLTVTAIHAGAVTMDVVRDTLAATTLDRLKVGDSVNLERALRVGDRLGGHFVSGHVDVRGKLEKIRRGTQYYDMWFSVPSSIMKYIAWKGSVAIDGISLTIQEVQKAGFKVTIIPHTLEITTFQFLKPGMEVNIEVDLLARYLESWQGARHEKPGGEGTGLTTEKLRRLGF